MGFSPSSSSSASTEDAGATVVIVLPGLGATTPLPGTVAATVTAAALVVAVDGGVDHALALGIPVHVAVGDFDSVSAAGLARVEAAGAEVQRHAEAKDQTDFELAIDTALAAGARRVLVVGGRGGRLDHALGNLLSLACPALEGVDVVARLDGSLVTVVRRRAELHGPPGSLLSLLPVGGPAVGVRTEGLRYPLHGEDLPAGSARGMSNVLLHQQAFVSLAGGVLLAIQPDEPGAIDARPDTEPAHPREPGAAP
jgi:thiamine pyrophosphokinase